MNNTQTKEFIKKVINGTKKEEKGYYYMRISKIPFTVWLTIFMIFTILSSGILFPLLVVPICIYFILTSCKYYYNNEKMIIETGVFNKKQFIVPLYRIVNITAQDNIFNYGSVFIHDKQQILELKYVKHSRAEMLALVEKWENARNQNLRHEII